MLEKEDGPQNVIIFCVNYEFYIFLQNLNNFFFRK